MNSRNNLMGINVQELRQKIGSKKELYDFLTQECNAYLPKMTCTNVYYLKQIVDGSKNRHDVIVTAIPQIEGLTADDFISYAQKQQQLLTYLPDQCDWLHLDKKWICDVLMTLDKQGVSTMVQSAKVQRQQRLDRTSNSIVQMRPEFAQALSNSVTFSSQKGRSAFLLKPGAQRKRRQNELEEVKEEEIKLNSSKQKYLEQNKRVRLEVLDLQEKVDELSEYKTLVMQLHSAGIINEDGNPLIQRQDFNDRSSLME